MKSLFLKCEMHYVRLVLFIAVLLAVLTLGINSLVIHTFYLIIACV